MIEKIVVHECSYDENGIRRQDIEIYYSFVQNAAMNGNGTRRQDIEIYYRFVGKIDWCPMPNARPIRHNGQVPDMERQNFLHFYASLSHINKKSSNEVKFC